MFFITAWLITPEFTAIWENIFHFQHKVLDIGVVNFRNVTTLQKWPNRKKNYKHKTILLESRKSKFNFMKAIKSKPASSPSPCKAMTDKELANALDLSETELAELFG